MKNVIYTKRFPRIWDTYYPIGKETDLALSLGLILYYLDFYDAAIVFFEKSLILYGQQAHVLFNVALCYYYTERFLESKSIVTKLLEKDAENEVYNELWIILSKRRNE
jgi:tetratricopeptide (TPR) repeat protein